RARRGRSRRRLAAVDDAHRLALGTRDLALPQHADLRREVEPRPDILLEALGLDHLELRARLDEHRQAVAARAALEEDLVLVARARALEDERLDLARVEVGPLEDDHVVGAAPEAVQAQMAPPADAGSATHDAREIAGAVADERQPLPRERGQHELALLAVGHEPAGGRVDDLAVVVVLPHVDAGMGRAVDAEPGPARLRHADDVEGLDPQRPLDEGAEVVGPHLRAQHGDTQAEPAEVERLLAGHLHEPERVGGDAGEHGGAQVLHQLELERRAPRAAGDHHGADPLGSVVEAEAAREQAERRGDLDHVPRGDVGGGVAARHDFSPLRDVGARVGVDDRVARGPGGHVHAPDALARTAGEPERVGVAQLVLHEKREAPPVGGGPDVLGFRAAEPPRIRRILVAARERLPQALEDQRLELVPGPRLDGRLEQRHPHSFPGPRAASARWTRSGRSGSSVILTPTASFTALATAAATGITPDSPSPLAPKGPASSTVSMSRIAISGMSPAGTSAYSMNWGLSTRPSWITSSSDSA